MNSSSSPGRPHSRSTLPVISPATAAFLDLLARLIARAPLRRRQPPSEHGHDDGTKDVGGSR